ncbi:MAG: hypothetical protein ACXVB0_24430 [Mucilaginibacter sp.]
MHLNRLSRFVVIFFTTILLFIHYRSAAQISKNDSAKLDYRKIYGYGLQANINQSLALLKVDSTKPISQKDKQFIVDFNNRFKYAEDKSNYLEERRSPIDTLINIFRDYWRMSLKNSDHDYDTLFVRNASSFLAWKYHLTTVRGELPIDTVDLYMTKYVRATGLHTNGLGKTGKLYDLLVWRKERDTTYEFEIQKEKIQAPVVFMDDFVSLGWEEYATLGKNYPGGWTTSAAIFTVSKAYDLKREDFLVDLLAHEGRHFGDTKLFPHLGGADLEYRAKLVEISLLKQSLYQTIEFFINDSEHTNYDNSHPFANYCVVRDLSKIFFNVEFEKDLSKWKTISCPRINAAAEKLLSDNTIALKNQGPDLKRYIK